ncbi:MAG: SAM-dependent methyltransferase [Deltaproteobacteria bacterium HGW-Deltaproteobacteria-19]|jgi:tRNA1Val (adenine37-N6)-methyltransferase|nr:MAG: SAM-dependent methyltransferase [Deltaproteobacteria bacterium HGW-Deltaproteobacteria-19]
MEHASSLKEDETLDPICGGRLRVIQAKRGYRFSVDSLLLASFVRLRPEETAADLGTGSGILALILATRPEHPFVEALELQPGLADRARRSAALNGLADRIRVREGDVRLAVSLLAASSFDLVVFNPPYRKARSGRINPNREKALARHEITGTLEDFLAAASLLLKEGGRVCAIYPATRAATLLAAMKTRGLEPKRIRLVHSRSDMEGEFVLVEGIRGGGEELEVMPPLFIYGDGDRYSGEMERIMDGLAAFPGSAGEAGPSS